MRFGSIGVFDSGVGGIPIAVKISERFPFEDIVYLGDNGNVPYGTKTGNEIFSLTLSGCRKLKDLGVKLIVVACNTASVNWRGGDDFEGVPVVGIKPETGEEYKGKRGLFVATPATVSAICKNRSFTDFAPAEFLALPFLAAEIENRLRSGALPDFRDHLPTIDDHLDFLYLGCTHYIYLEGDIKRAYPSLALLDGVDKIIEKISKYVEFSNVSAPRAGRMIFVGKYAEFNASISEQIFGNGQRIEIYP